MRSFDSQWEVKGGSVLEILSFDSWIPEMKNVYLIQFRMGVVCVDEMGVFTHNKEYRPQINVPQELRQKKGGKLKHALCFSLESQSW